MFGIKVFSVILYDFLPTEALAKVGFVVLPARLNDSVVRAGV